MKTDLTELPKVKDVYITMLPGNDYREVATKAAELIKSGFNPVPHFPARSIKNQAELKDYINRCFSSYKSGIIHPKIDKDWRKKVDQYFSYIMAKRLMYQHWFIDTPKKK